VSCERDESAVYILCITTARKVMVGFLDAKMNDINPNLFLNID